MLSHKDIHYLIGMLNKSHQKEDVEITLGELIYDKAANKSRDVDIAIKTRQKEVPYLTGIEVKNEKEPLDVTTVEQLTRKLDDMPEISKKAIVSTSGYTKGAIDKANYYDTDLYVLEKYDVEAFEHIKMPPNFSGHEEISGVRVELPTELKQLRMIGSQKPLLGACIMEIPNGNLFGISFCNDDRVIRGINIPLSERTKTVLRRIKL